MRFLGVWPRSGVWVAVVLAATFAGAANGSDWDEFELLLARQKANLARVPALDMEYRFAVDRASPDQIGGTLARVWEAKARFAFESPGTHFLGHMRWDVDQWLLSENGTKVEVSFRFARNLERAYQRTAQTGSASQFISVPLSQTESGKSLFPGTLPWNWSDQYAGVCDYKRDGPLKLLSLARTEQGGKPRCVVTFRHREDESVATLVYAEDEGCLPVRTTKSSKGGAEGVCEATNARYPLRESHFFFPMKVVYRYSVGGKLDTTTCKEVVPGSVRVCEDGLDDALFTLRDDPADVLIVNGRAVREPKVGVVNDPQGTDARNTEQPARADPAKGGPVQP